jgi:alkylation response protein AidB-like acyl-CoA dehydrogenase
VRVDFNFTREQKEIVRAARDFVQGEFPEVAAEVDRNESFDLKLREKTCELSFVGIFIPSATVTSSTVNSYILSYNILL